MEIGPCPSIAEGAGNVVIGRFETRNANDLVVVTLDDGISITGTRIHPVWSLDRLDWIELGELKDDEVLQGIDGPAAVWKIEFLTASQPVYNLEILGEHVYRVGKCGVLSHNTDPLTCTYILKPKAPKGGPGVFADDAARIIGESAKSRGLNPGSGVLNMARKLDIKAIDRIVTDLNLTKAQRRLLHDEITKQGFTLEEILEIAKEIIRLYPNK